MYIKLLIIGITVNAVVAQLFLKRALQDAPSPGLSFDAMWRFLLAAMQSPWTYVALALQVAGFVLWMVLISKEKLGVATASVGAGFYLLMAFAAWAVYGETLTSLQWAGILFVTVGVICISLARVG
ncbi:MAG: hypothetical protein JNM76_09530 [Betaproteobacteria bacterium]|nr:hypothetical protein [Betaproteobacteria bacterium]